MRAKKTFYSSFVLQPILHGVVGFFVFFSILLLTKLLAFWLGTQSHFSIETEDVILSFVGFILLGLIRMFDNFKSKEVEQLKN
ncbi:MAG: hypothetical protein FD143_2714 [Ignavibacteria bacterium]|nr:MAG: hypothetical protein FD143_2714 [Ignavibacteria bacterium]KAF0157792.1 MAG: hypothetical protein FD188_2670 [Ignavibacteria bacterium]